MQIMLEEIEDVCVVHLDGVIDFESADSFRASFSDLFNKKKIVFNLKNLSFVGSSGVIPLLETIAEISQKNQKHTKFCGVSKEFLKMFEYKGISHLDIHENTDKACMAFKNSLPQDLDDFLKIAQE